MRRVDLLRDLKVYLKSLISETTDGNCQWFDNLTR
jgi:hypothetical protein